MKYAHTRMAAIGLAAALALTGIGPGVGFGYAKVIDGYVTEQSVSTIDGTRLIDLTIRKTGPNPYDEIPPGSLPPAPLAGTTFTVQRVQGIDLTTQEGWDRARSLTPETARLLGLEAPVSAVTDDKGEAHFTGLPVGLYYVVEVPRHLDGHVNYIAAPFLITLPTGSIDGVSWDYVITVIAKGTPETDTPPGEDEPTPSPSTTHPTPPPTPPAEPTQPSAPGSPGQPSSPVRDSPGRLASTGASVIGLVLVGSILIGSGLLIARRRRSD